MSPLPKSNITFTSIEEGDYPLAPNHLLQKHERQVVGMENPLPPTTEPQFKVLKSLRESLDEEINGDNQYFCDSCKERVDATRSIKLRSLPEVLNIQLKRCVFLPKTTTRKKITSAFCFPGELDMKGSSADTLGKCYGHYIAHIKDEKTGIWWWFDDENVSKLGYHPFEDFYIK
ncbi:hypothetical protein SAY86_004795 [Trapa natans]|uniref:ubiquitinyl hydrolase 1 n=1 Tax=Trapa natans TaxID=22666 RepID=A0AAN7RQS6_TRANT|nr:hypothetical protein SAY86_004795 [Trapa natans]